MPSVFDEKSNKKGSSAIFAFIFMRKDPKIGDCMKVTYIVKPAVPATHDHAAYDAVTAGFFIRRIKPDAKKTLRGVENIIGCIGETRGKMVMSEYCYIPTGVDMDTLDLSDDNLRKFSSQPDEPKTPVLRRASCPAVGTGGSLASIREEGEGGSDDGVVADDSVVLTLDFSADEVSSRERFSRK